MISYFKKSIFIVCLISILPYSSTHASPRKNGGSYPDDLNKKTFFDILPNDTTKNSYVSYHRINFSFGRYLRNKNWAVEPINDKYFLSVCYRISGFSDSLECHENQIGLYNEWGIRNISVYYNFGPEFRIIKKMYLIPYIGISLGIITGAEKSGIGFNGILGSKVGYFVEINDSFSIIPEFWGEMSVFNEKNYTFYFKLGISMSI